LHTPAEIAVGTASGYVKLIGHMDLCSSNGVTIDACLVVNRLFQWLGVLGFLVALAHPLWWWVPVAFVLVQFPVAFLYDRRLVEMYRHTYPAFPLFLLSAGVAAGWVGRCALRGVRLLTKSTVHAPSL
jgi:hypothetical protein